MQGKMKRTLINQKYFTELIKSFKIIFAAVCAILLAHTLHLEFSISAGIVAILSVGATKRETVKTALTRLEAFLLALFIAGICFFMMGYQLYAFLVYLTCFIICCCIFGWYSAMALDSVLISHFLTYENMSIQSILNETGLFMIGISFGILVNIHLHKNTYTIDKMKNETDEMIKTVLHRMAERIRNPKLPNYDGHCFIELQNAIQKAAQMAETNFMNQLRSRDQTDIRYIAMRSEQISVLRDMYEGIRVLKTTPSTAADISDFLNHVADEYHRDNTVRSLLEEFEVLREKMKSTVLPKTREEFEERSELYVLLRNTKKFLTIKADYARNKRTIRVDV